MHTITHTSIQANGHTLHFHENILTDTVHKNNVHAHYTLGVSHVTELCA